MGLVISSTRADFQSPNGLTAQTVIVSGGLPPYSAASSDTDVCSVAQATSPNVYGNSDTLSDSTLTGLTKASGGPGGATDAEYTGSGSPIGSNAILDRVVPVVMGKTYLPSFFIDPSQITNNTGSTPNVLTEFSGSTQNADGTYSIPNGTTSATKYTLSAGQSITASVDSAKGVLTGSSEVFFGTMSGGVEYNGYSIRYDSTGQTHIIRWIANAGSYLASSGIPNDVNFHTVRLSVIVGATNSIVVSVDTNTLSATDSSVTLSGVSCGVTLYNNGGKFKNYTINPQVALGLNTADGLTQVLQQYVAINTTTAGRYATASWTCPTNLIASSDGFSGWIISSMTQGTGGPGGAADLEATGTGASQSVSTESAVQTVTGGIQHTFSVYLDPSHITSGTYKIFIESADRSTVYGSQQAITSGPAGRYSVSGLIPNGVTQCRVVFTTAGATTTSGATIRFSQPMLEPKSSASGYYISSQNPQVHVYAQLLSSAIVASGQKFKISQPLLAPSTYDPQTYIAQTAVFTVTPKYSGSARITYSDSTP